MSSTSDEPMRVVVVIKTSQGGLWLVPHVDELRRRGHEVVVVLPSGTGRLSEALGARGVPVVESAFAFRFRLRPRTILGLLRLRRQLRELRPDVLHYHLYASALAARLSTIGLGIPRVHMVAGPLYLESRLIRWVERLMVRMDTTTIGGSEFTADLYRALGRGADVTPAIPYGLDCEHFRPASAEVRQAARDQLGLPSGAFVVIMVALVYAPRRSVHAGLGIKGHDIVLQAWRRFSGEHPDAHLLLVGAGFDAAGEAHRKDLVRHFGIDDDGSVTWRETVRDVRPFYAAADLSVSPSRSENHGAAVEAGAMGLPSIVTSVGGLPEVVPSGSGWVIEPGSADALRAALESAYATDRDELAARGARARELVARAFDRDTCAGAVADVLEAAKGPRVPSVFAEARFGRDSTGSWAAVDSANGDEAWRRYAVGSSHPSVGVRAVVRADRRLGTAANVLSDRVEVRPLPYYIGLRELFRVALPFGLAVWRRVSEADRIVLRVPGAVGSAAAVSCRLRRRQYAVEVVGDPADVLSSGVLGRVGRLARPLVAAHLRWVVGGAVASLFVTQTELQRRYPPRPGTATVAMSRVLLRDADFVAAARSRGAGKNHIISVGSHEQRYKGHDVLLRALRLLRDDGVDVHVTIVGGGRYHDELHALADELGVRPWVTFTGVVNDRETVRSLLDSASLFALPSRAEGTPRALIEAMARALPAVGTAVGGTKELLLAGSLVPVDDVGALAHAMRTLLEDPARWEEQSRRNLMVAQGFRLSVLEPRFQRWLRSVPPARGRPLGRRRSPERSGRPDALMAS